MAIGRWVIGPLAAVQISGTVKGQFRCGENNGGNSSTLSVAIKIIQPGGADRATLLAASASDLSTTVPPEFLTSTDPSTGAANRSFNNASEQASITLTAQTPTAGDYLVIEVGWRSANTNSGRTNYIRYGDAVANDNPENQTDTNDYCPWIEFSQTLPINQTITPGFAAGTGSAFLATILAGAVTLTPGFGTGTGAGYDATLSTTSNQSITPGFASGTAVAYNSTLLAGPVTIVPGLAQGTGAAYNPTLSPGPVTLTAGFASGSGLAYGSTLSPGPVTITPGKASCSGSSYSPILSPGGVTITSGLATGTGAAFDSTIATGTVTLTAGVATGTGASFDSTISSGGGEIFITPGTATGTGQAFGTTIIAEGGGTGHIYVLVGGAWKMTEHEYVKQTTWKVVF